MAQPQRTIGAGWISLDRNRPRRAVFYGRVSTEHEAQLSALENQMQWYDDQAKYHPNWTIVCTHESGVGGSRVSQKQHTGNNRYNDHQDNNPECRFLVIHNTLDPFFHTYLAKGERAGCDPAAVNTTVKECGGVGSHLVLLHVLDYLLVTSCFNIPAE